MINSVKKTIQQFDNMRNSEIIKRKAIEVHKWVVDCLVIMRLQVGLTQNALMNILKKKRSKKN